MKKLVAQCMEGNVLLFIQETVLRENGYGQAPGKPGEDVELWTAGQAAERQASDE